MSSTVLFLHGWLRDYGDGKYGDTDIPGDQVWALEGHLESRPTCRCCRHGWR